MTEYFKQQKKVGEKAQAWVVGMFRSWGLHAAQTKRGYHPERDIVISGTLHGRQIRNTVEVKYDKKASETGNIYIDLESLSRSSASILVILLGEAPKYNALVMPLQDCLNFARTWHDQRLGGEFRERAAVIPKEEFRQLSFVKQV